MTDTDLDIAGLRSRLEARREELETLAEAHASDSATVELDQSRVGRLSRMDAMQAQEMARETARRRKAELARIENAVKRLEGGDYGYCVSCDEAIAIARLELDPSTLTCIRCAGRG